MTGPGRSCAVPFRRQLRPARPRHPGRPGRPGGAAGRGDGHAAALGAGRPGGLHAAPPGVDGLRGRDERLPRRLGRSPGRRRGGGLGRPGRRGVGPRLRRAARARPGRWSARRSGRPSRSPASCWPGPTPDSVVADPTSDDWEQDRNALLDRSAVAGRAAGPAPPGAPLGPAAALVTLDDPGHRAAPVRHPVLRRRPAGRPAHPRRRRRGLRRHLARARRRPWTRGGAGRCCCCRRPRSRWPSWPPAATWTAPCPVPRCPGPDARGAGARRHDLADRPRSIGVPALTQPAAPPPADDSPTPARPADRRVGHHACPVRAGAEPVADDAGRHQHLADRRARLTDGHCHRSRPGRRGPPAARPRRGHRRRPARGADRADPRAHGPLGRRGPVRGADRRPGPGRGPAPAARRRGPERRATC